MDPHENKAQAPNINADEPPPTFIDKIIAPWKLLGKQKILLATLGFIFFFGSILVPGPVLITYLKFKNMHDLEIAAFHGLAPLVGIVGTWILPWFIDKVGYKPISLFNVWLLTILLSVCIIQFYILETWKNYQLTQWIMLAPILLARAPQWSLEFIENQMIRNYVAKDEVHTIKAVQWMSSNAFHVFVHVIAIVAYASKNFPIVGTISFAFALIGSILYTVWVAIYGKEMGDKIIPPEKDNEAKEKEHYLDHQDLDMEHAMSDISSESESQ